MVGKNQNPPPYSNYPPPHYGPNSQIYPPATHSPHIPPQVPLALPINHAPVSYGSTTFLHPNPAGTRVIILGGCPACGVGILEDDYTVCGVLLAVFLFPIGILFCLLMKQRRCPHCHAIFG